MAMLEIHSPAVGAFHVSRSRLGALLGTRRNRGQDSKCYHAALLTSRLDEVL